MRRTHYGVEHESTGHRRAHVFVDEDTAFAVRDILTILLNREFDVVEHAYGRSPRLDAHAELIRVGTPSRETWERTLKPPPRVLTRIKRAPRRARQGGAR